MNPEYEFIPHNPGLSSFRCMQFEANRLPFNWHYHPYFELTWIRSGNGNRLIGHDIGHFSTDDLVLLAPGLPHTWFTPPGGDSGNPVEATVCHFPEKLTALWREVPELTHVSKLIEASKSGIIFPAEVASELRTRLTSLMEAKEARKFLLLMETLQILAESQWKPIFMKGKVPSRPNEKITSRIRDTHDYIIRNYKEQLQLEEVARIAHLSPVAFSRFFSHEMGKPFTQYVVELRVNHACNLLLTTELSIAEIAYQVGFRTLSNFNRQFLAIKNQTPSEYRKQLYTL